jgi:hypothetical protein
MEKSSSQRVIIRLVPALALWGLAKALDTPAVKGALHEADAHAYIQKRKAIRSVRRAGKNAVSNPAWLAAGAAAIAVGIGLMAKAARGR